MNVGLAIFCVVVSLATWSHASPASAQYRLDQWTADNGLPQNSVRAIVQTRDGYIWFTTFDGLVRFDGVRFTVFDKTNSPGIPGNRFVSIFEDRYGDLWVALETGELVRRHDGRFETFAAEQGLLGDAAVFIFPDADGNAIVCYERVVFDPKDNRVSSAGLEAYRWSDGRFWHDETLDICVPAERLSFGKVRFVYASLEGSGACVWYASAERLYRYAKDGTLRVFGVETGLPGVNPSLVSDQDGRLQAVTRDATGGLWLTDVETMASRMIGAHAPDPFDVRNGYADREGNLWLATYSSGLLRARVQTITPYDASRGLTAREVYPVLAGRDGALWVGTFDGGLFRFEDGRVTRYPTDGVVGGVYSLFEDRAGRLWVNGYLELVDGRLVPAPWRGVAGAETTDMSFAMCEDRDGAYWFGTDRGVVRYRDGRATLFTVKDGLAGNDTKVIVEDGQGGLWLGSHGGITHYTGGAFTAFTEKDGLAGDTVRALELDPDGTLWIGTYDGGLGRFKDGRFTRYTTKDGLFDNGVFQILEDDAGWFWMSCNRGIYRVRRQELVDFAEGRVATIYCKDYDKADGMPSAECNGGRWPAGARTPDGKLWFPTMGGVAMIDPSLVRTNTPPPPVVIEAMRINNQAADIATPSAIRVEPGQDNFEIEYTALSFVNSENLRFKYKLDGADGDWVDAGTRRTAYYSHVEPGDYTFRVIAANADGVWNESGASMRVTVVPPFWRTRWFTALAASVVAGAVAAVWQYRESQVRRRQTAQQAFSRRLIASQEAERKRIAGELHDSLGQNLLIVKNWALVGLNALDRENPAREHLTEISETTSLALDEVREIAHNLRPYQLERLGLTNTLDYTMRQIKSSSDVEFTVELENVDGLLSPESEINLYRVVQEAINNVIKHSEATDAWLTVTRSANGIRVVCRDNGRGFDPGAAARSRLSGMGLTGLAERVRMLGGDYAIESAIGAGTTVTITVETAKR